MIDEDPGVPEPGAERGDYEPTQTWSAEVRDSLLASRRAGWIVAAGAAVLAFVEGLALSALPPLQRIMPYVISVDRRTGYIVTVQSSSDSSAPDNLVATEAAISRFVTARATFEATGALSAYEAALRDCAGQARRDLLRLSMTMKRTRANGVSVVLHRLQFPSLGVARVSFTEDLHGRGAGMPSEVRIAFLADTGGQGAFSGPRRIVITDYQPLTVSEAAPAVPPSGMDLSPRAVLGR